MLSSLNTEKVYGFGVKTLGFLVSTQQLLSSGVGSELCLTTLHIGHSVAKHVNNYTPPKGLLWYLN